MKIKLSTYSEGQQLPAHHFFILNKGLNAGKPSEKPWTNCFVAEFETLDERDQYYWLCYAIWITGKFKYYLSGSVILFIRKDELISLLELAATAIHSCKDAFIKSVSLLHEAEVNSKHLTAKIATLQRAKVEILRHFISL